MDSATRHWRFLNNGEFDVAEVSSSSYLAARDNDWPFRAIPVFLHRRFRHGFMFINTGKGISKPADLKGRRIGVKTLMTSAVLWMRGILAARIRRAVELDRMGRRDRQRRRRDACRRTSNIPACRTTNRSTPCWPKANSTRCSIPTSSSRSSPRTRAWRACSPITRRRRWPISSAPASSRSCMSSASGRRWRSEHPWLAVNLFRAFNEAKAIAMKRMANPRIVPLAWYRAAWEEQERVLGPDPWEYGLTDKNRKNPGNAGRLFARAGTDQEAADARAAFSQRRPRPQARRRVPHLEICAPPDYNK